MNGSEVDGGTCENPAAYISRDGVHYKLWPTMFWLSDPPISIILACMHVRVVVNHNFGLVFGFFCVIILFYATLSEKPKNRNESLT